MATHMKEKHPRNQPRSNDRGNEALDLKYLLNNYDLSILSKNKDHLATFLSEALKIKEIRPKIDEMQGNGYIR